MENQSTTKHWDVSADVLNNVIRRLYEAEVIPDKALDELVGLDPETDLGRAMTDVMILIATLKLFDYYKGYERRGNMIKMYLAADAPTEKLEQLVDEITMDVETAPGDEQASIIKARLYRSSTDPKEFSWIVELQVLSPNVDFYSGAPVQIELGGVIKVDDSETPGGVPAGTEKTVPED